MGGTGVINQGGGSLSGNIGSFIKGQIRRVSGRKGRSQADEAKSSAAGRAAAGKQPLEEMSSPSNKTQHFCLLPQFSVALPANEKLPRVWHESCSSLSFYFLPFRS